MSDRFRDLEFSGRAERKDAVLLATISSFEAMDRPTRRDLRQFSDLFLPMFAAASTEARRTAAASLSRADMIPEAVARFILEQPIDIAAPFIVHSTALSDRVLIDAITARGVAHGRAAARRRTVSPALLAVLAAFGDAAIDRSLMLRSAPLSASEETPAPAALPADDRRAREDDLRNKLRSMVMRNRSDHAAPPALPSRLPPDIEARLDKHIVDGEVVYFATALADALGSRFELSERIMMDGSGAQLAQTLVALGLRYTTIIAALERFFPYLREGDGEHRKSLALLRSCSFVECVDRVTAWQRADWSARRATFEPSVTDGQRRGQGGEQRTAYPRSTENARPLRRA